MNEDSQGAISVEQMAEMMTTRREPKGQPETEVNAEEQTEQDVEDTTEAEEVDADEVEADEGQTDDDDAQDEVDEDDDDAELYYDFDGEEISASQLKEWKTNGLLQKDYTQKTQALAEQRKALEAEAATTQQLRTQLQDALATFAIDNEPAPDWVKLSQELDPKEFQQAQTQWQAQQAQKQQATQTYQALQAQQQQEIVAREKAAILEHFPQWSDPKVFTADFPKLADVAQPYGFTPEEIGGNADHRVYRILHRLAEAEAQLAEVGKTAGAISKRVVKAKAKLPAGSKPAKNQSQRKEVQQSRDRVKKTGSVQDAVALMQAKRAG